MVLFVSLFNVSITRQTVLLDHMGKTVPVNAGIRIMEEIVNKIVRTATKNCAILH